MSQSSGLKKENNSVECSINRNSNFALHVFVYIIKKYDNCKTVFVEVYFFVFVPIATLMSQCVSVSVSACVCVVALKAFLARIFFSF